MNAERGWQTETHIDGKRTGKTEVMVDSAKQLISSVRVERSGGHDHVHVWNGGGKAGILIVNAGDGDKIKRRLLGEKAD